MDVGHLWYSMVVCVGIFKCGWDISRHVDINVFLA